MKPKSAYQKLLHDNYHVAQKLGPAKGCPYCPAEPSPAAQSGAQR